MKRLSRWKNSPVWPALLSAFVAPGMGQIANREVPKGLLLLAASIGSFFWFSKIVTERLAAIFPGPPEKWMTDQDQLRDGITRLVNENPDMFLTFQILMIVVWTFGVVDAYLTARKRAKIAATGADDISHP